MGGREIFREVENHNREIVGNGYKKGVKPKESRLNLNLKALNL